MKEFDDTLQICTLHRILQTMDEPCQECLHEMREASERRRQAEQIEQAICA